MSFSLPLGTTWSGEAHVLEYGRTIPLARSLLNSALAATNFSGERRRRIGKGRTAFGESVKGDTMSDRGITGARSCQ